MRFFKNLRDKDQSARSSETAAPVSNPAENTEGAEDAAEKLPAVEDKREKQEYFDAGIQIHRKNGKAEEFYYRGQRVSQEEADKIADFLIENGRCPSDDEL